MKGNESVSESTKTVAVIPAAGSGLRMGSARAKQFMDIGGKPLLAATIEPFERCPKVDAIILAAPPEDMGYCKREIVERFGLVKVKKVIPGGKERQDSVRLALEAVEGAYGLVLIHDGVRPVIDEGLIERVLEAAKTHRAVITALAPKETVKEINSLAEVVKTRDRKRIRLVQTPQVFRFHDILAAHQKAVREGGETATDDSVLIERLGIPVKVIEGSEKNIKVTTPDDLEMARFLLGRDQ